MVNKIVFIVSSESHKEMVVRDFSKLNFYNDVIEIKIKDDFTKSDYQGWQVINIEQKKDGLVMDFAGNFKEHGSMIDDSWLYIGSHKDESKKPLHKVCPNCEELLALNAPECTACGYVPLKEEREVWFEPNFDDTTDLNAKRNPVKWYAVTKVEYIDNWVSSKGNKMLKVKYFVNNSTYFAEYVMDFKRKSWFNMRGNTDIWKDLKIPKKVLVNTVGKYKNIEDFKW